MKENWEIINWKTKVIHRWRLAVNKYIISYVFLLSLNRFVASRLKERKQNRIFLFSWIHNHQTLTLTFNFTPIWQNLVFFLPTPFSFLSCNIFYAKRGEKTCSLWKKREKSFSANLLCCFAHTIGVLHGTHLEFFWTSLLEIK